MEAEAKAETARLAALKKSNPKAYLKEIQSRPEYADELKQLDPKAYAAYQVAEKKKAEQVAREALRASSDLQVTNWSWGAQYSHAIVNGQVRNLRDTPLKNVQAVVSFYTADGTFIDSASALIDYTTLLPGQASPFKVINNWNPAMKKATLEFKFLLGGRLNSYEGK
ncbi:MULTISPECIES: FxLYD domain-containing protein [unclassified Chelatococcus]|uniref:FxLYD domain-containing protein n=1 Tax=unclassified Chelatococcus TaxID=2638111 RepID=UPI001BD06F27|nr:MULTISPECIES: FxLYD domain-containing protein [unclassified Chelatococcus]MBS7701588.1 FxLYD domain-containing protein [Chelatococcus sp. YT9]MBX3557423.1 FxLYD domain-containing protein [Chelatococcus sp.]